MGEIGAAAPAASEVVRRPDALEPYLRGCAFRSGGGVAYPRANPRDRDRLPCDTWGAASIPVGVRLEFIGTATKVEVSYRTSTDELGYRGKGAGTAFCLYASGALVDEQAAVLGEGSVALSCVPGVRNIVYLPEGMRPMVLGLRAVAGTLDPAPPQPRWVCYGDSIAEGWTASSPALAWPARLGREVGLDVINMGYAGAARGEIASAEQIAALEDVAVVTVSHGTNCWTRTPHSAAQVYENTLAFLEIVRQGHPEVPLVVVSPVVRPDAEAKPNRLGATLADIRRAIEEAAARRASAGDLNLTVIGGADLIGLEHLADGIHPNDDGHRRLADALGPILGSLAASPASEGSGQGPASPASKNMTEGGGR